MTAICSFLRILWACRTRRVCHCESARKRSTEWMARASSYSFRLQEDSQGWKQTRPQTPGKGLSSLISSQASRNFPCRAKTMNPSTSFPAGHASLHGGVFTTYFGLRYLQLPVSFHSIVPKEMEIGGMSWRCLRLIFCFIRPSALSPAPPRIQALAGGCPTSPALVGGVKGHLPITWLGAPSSKLPWLQRCFPPFCREHVPGLRE